MTIFKERRQVVQLVDVNTGVDQQFDKPYLLLLRDYTGEDITEETEFVGVPIRGRKNAFIYISSSISNYDLINSYVMSGNIKLGQEVTLYTFVRVCIENNKIPVSDMDGITKEYLNDLVCEIHPDIDDDYLERLYKTDLTAKR